jgi:integrase
MYSTSTFLARRKASTVRGYKRALARFAKHVGSTTDTLHEYLDATPRETLVGDLLTFSDTLNGMGQNTQRNYVAAIMSYLSYNDINLPKAQRSQIVIKRGDVFRDRALSVAEVKKVSEYLQPVGKMALLILFTSGVRLGELLQMRESDVEGKIIHLKGSYTKTGASREVVISTECMNYMNDIWLPQKQDYLKSAVKRNKGLMEQEEVGKRAGVKSEKDDRIIPLQTSTAYGMLMRAFKNAGFSDKSGDRNLYHPHGLRKSFRSIVGSQNPDLAEKLMGHAGYLSMSYVRFDDLVKEYEKIEHLLTLSGNGGNGRLKVLEEENAGLKAQYASMVTQMEVMKRQMDAIMHVITPEYKAIFEDGSFIKNKVIDISTLDKE